MTGRTYSVTEVVGTSDKSVDDAIETAIKAAGESLRHMDWFEVGEIRGHIDHDRVAHYQVTMKIGFQYEPPTERH